MQLPASGTIARPSSGATRVGAVSRWQAGYAGVVLFACALTFLVITWGGLVRAEGAGLACPDWPLCNGHVIPDADKLVLI
jgi:heme A synthase